MAELSLNEPAEACPGVKNPDVASLHPGYASLRQLDQSTVEMSPRVVATIQRLPQRTMESTRPTPGTVSPVFARQTPSGPCKTAVPPTTSRTDQPSMVVGLVSGTGAVGLASDTDAVDLGDAFARSFALADAGEEGAYGRLGGTSLLATAPARCALPRAVSTGVGAAAAILPVLPVLDVTSRSDLKAAHSASLPESEAQSATLSCLIDVVAGASARRRYDAHPPTHPSPSITRMAATSTAGRTRRDPENASFIAGGSSARKS